MEEANFSDVKSVISDEMKFKAKLAIGEEAYAALRNANSVRKYWDLFGAVAGGAAIAKTSVVASAFFAPQGILGLLGLATAVTPIGWVVAAGVLSGGAWYAVMQGLNGAKENRVDVIPKFINTPIDVIATTLFGLMAPLALKVAAADSHVSDDERTCIRDYFVNQWGFDVGFVDAGLQLIEPNLGEFKISEVAEKLVEYKKTNPDCNYEVMAQNLLAFLQEVMESDGAIDEREQLVLDKVKSIFDEADRVSVSDTLSKFGSGVSESIKKRASAVGKSARDGVDAVASSETMARVKTGADVAATTAANFLSTGADKAARTAANLLKKFT